LKKASVVVGCVIVFSFLCFTVGYSIVPERIPDV
jgi:hypothetical protein